MRGKWRPRLLDYAAEHPAEAVRQVSTEALQLPGAPLEKRVGAGARCTCPACECILSPLCPPGSFRRPVARRNTYAVRDGHHCGTLCDCAPATCLHRAKRAQSARVHMTLAHSPLEARCRRGLEGRADNTLLAEGDRRRHRVCRARRREPRGALHERRAAAGAPPWRCTPQGGSSRRSQLAIFVDTPVRGLPRYFARLNKRRASPCGAPLVPRPGCTAPAIAAP